MVQNISNIEDVLERDGVILQSPIGVSMRPMLRGSETPVVISSIKEPVKINDVVLFRRNGEKYVLHRLIRIKDGLYTFRGDNCFSYERDIQKNHLIGVLDGFYKGERYIDCKTNKAYKLYVIFWRTSYPLRYAYIIIFSKAKRFLKRIIGRDKS